MITIASKRWDVRTTSLSQHHKDDGVHDLVQVAVLRDHADLPALLGQVHFPRQSLAALLVKSLLLLLLAEDSRVHLGEQ